MARYALVNIDGIVENVCHWDGNLETWQPPDGIQAIEIPDTMWGGPDDRWDPTLNRIVPNE